MIACLYSTATGVLTGDKIRGRADLVALQVREGFALIEGDHDHNRVRVDITTGELVPYRPDPPPDSELLTWQWDDDAWCWRSSHTARAQQILQAEERMRRVLELESSQARPLRELLLNPGDSDARRRLAQLERDIADLRALGLPPTP